MFLPPAAATSDPLLPVLALTLLLTVGIALLLKRLRLPALPGYFLCGFLLARTHLLDLSPGSNAEKMLMNLGNVGVVLLLFGIGVECSVQELRQLRKHGLRIGLLQVGLTSLLFTGVALVCGQGWASILWGIIGAVSSTAVGVKLFEDSGIPGHTGARVTLGIALVQDIVIILVLLLLPAFAGGDGLTGAAKATGLLALEGIAFVAAAMLLSRWGIPQLLRAVSKTRARDLFTLMVLALCAGIASLAQLFGIGVTIGAFAAGVAVSGSVYSHRILADAAPFRDFFLTLFFVAVGALADPQFLAENWQIIGAISVGILVLKSALTMLAGGLSHAAPGAALLAAAALSGIGEFAIVLGREASGRGLITADQAQFILAVTALTMSLSPFFMRAMIPVAKRLDDRPSAAPPPTGKKAAGFSRRVKEMEDHAILCGYGTVGQILHKGLTRLGIPVVIIELNAETVAGLLQKGHPCLFADIAQADTLELAGVTRARVIIISFPHAETARAAITIARERNPGILTFCRARFPHEAAMLRALAPDSVVHDELEAGVKMLRLCARGYEKDETELFPRISAE
jgi:CPA2 family monovalent cation:H+ antiporter-2